MLTGRGNRLRLSGEEVGKVLGYYDLGKLHRVTDFAKGAVASPKALVKTSKGSFLLKRRADGVKDPQGVAFSHDLQIYLKRCGYPLPGLVGIKSSGNSMLRIGDDVYELFHFVRGRVYDHGVLDTLGAGQSLGRLHVLLGGFGSDFKSPTGSFHGNAHVLGHLRSSYDAVLRVEKDLGERQRGELKKLIEQLAGYYQRASGEVEQRGIGKMRVGMIHGDWHPGNMLYDEKGAVVGVLDYDSARARYWVEDLANGLLQFSMLGRGEKLADWPVGLDDRRFYSFLRGYERMGRVLSAQELGVLPGLMVEALISEAIGPIAGTGRFGNLRGSTFLLMILRKVKWLAANGAGLVRI